MKKPGRPVTVKPEHLIDAARENDAICRLNASELKRLLIFYFDGSLAKWDSNDELPTGMGSQLRVFFAKTSGKTLIQRASHELMKQIIDTIHNTPGLGFEHGWWSYCLRIWAGLENQYSKENDDLPLPNGGHIREAYRMYARLVHEKILNTR